MKTQTKINYLSTDVMEMKDGKVIFKVSLWDKSDSTAHTVYLSDTQFNHPIIDRLEECKMGDELECVFDFRPDRDNPGRYKLALVGVV